ncbi:MAG: hypothetical protein ACRDPA_24950, partial [Solirubrobacteraceae bacterium]
MSNPDVPGSGVIAAAYWLNDTGSPIRQFRTGWTVPLPPTTAAGQQIYLYQGLGTPDGTMLLRAVLQYGESPAGGGAGWSVASWWTDATTGAAQYSDVVPVDWGMPMVPVIRMVSDGTEDFVYSCSFEFPGSLIGTENAQLVINAPRELTWCTEALEAYGITQASDYPDADCAPMTGIFIETEAGPPSVAWTREDLATDFGEHTVVAEPHEIELYYRLEPSWRRQDLTQTSKAPPAAGDPVCYSWDLDGTDNVVYRGTDDHIHQLTFDGVAWHWTDVTQAADPPPTSTVATDPAAYTFDQDRSQHIVYRGADGHIHELWSSGTWHHHDLTVAAPNAPLAASKPFGYVWRQDDSQHVVYRGHDNSIHELYTHGSWRHNDLCQQADVAKNATGAPTAYVDEPHATEHVIYSDHGGNLHELWYDDSWHANGLFGIPAVGDPFGLMGTDLAQHVLYRGRDDHIHELRYDGSWTAQDVMLESAGPQAAVSEPIVYRAGGELRLVYRGGDDRLHRLRLAGPLADP